MPFVMHQRWHVTWQYGHTVHVGFAGICAFCLAFGVCAYNISKHCYNMMGNSIIDCLISHTIVQLVCVEPLRSISQHGFWLCMHSLHPVACAGCNFKYARRGQRHGVALCCCCMMAAGCRGVALKGPCTDSSGRLRYRVLSCHIHCFLQLGVLKADTCSCAALFGPMSVYYIC
jgi:hypothetical protein